MHKKSPKIRHLNTIAQLCRAISTIGKKLLNSNTSPTCPYNMVNFDPLAAEIVSLVFGTPANVNGFRVLAALLHGTQLWASTKLCGVEQRAPPIYSAGRPSGWTFAHTSSFFFISSPNLSGRTLDVYHTSTHGVALVRIWNAGLKCAASGSLKYRTQK